MGNGFALNDTTDVIKQSINDTFNYTYTSNTNASCTNNESVVGANGCNINFANQVCVAIAISNSVSNLQNTDELTQSVYTNLAQAASASNTNSLWLGQTGSSYAINIANIYTDMSLSITKNISTTCSKSASGNNTQSVTDCNASSISFSPQTVSVSAVGDCTSNVVANTKAGQALTQIIAQTATATTGFDFAQLAMFAVIIAIVGAVAIYLKHRNQNQKVAPPGAMDECEKYRAQAAENGDVAAQDPSYCSGVAGAIKPPQTMFSRLSLGFFACFCLTFIVWIIVFLAMKWPPYPYTDYGLCDSTQDPPITAFATVPKFPPFDSKCLSIGGGCSDGLFITYNGSGCGLFGGPAGTSCTDPEFVTESTNWAKLQAACQAFGLATPGGPASCARADILNYILNVYIPPGCANSDQSCNTSYAGCTACTSDNGSPSNVGLYVASSGGSFDCNTALVQTPHIPYLNSGAYACTKGTVSAGGTGICAGNATDLVNYPTTGKNFNDCPNDSYQARKQQWVVLSELCTVITANRPTSFPADAAPSAICAYPLSSALSKCNAQTGACTYTPTSGGPNPAVVALACKNDFSTCVSDTFVADTNRTNTTIDQCKSRQTAYNVTGNAMLAVFIILMLLFLALTFAMYVIDKKKKAVTLQAIAKGDWDKVPPPNAKTKNRPVIVTVVMACFIVIGLGVVLYAFNPAQGVVPLSICVVAAVLGGIIFIVYLNYEKAKENITRQTYSDQLAYKQGIAGYRAQQAENAQAANQKRPAKEVSKPKPVKGLL